LTIAFSVFHSHKYVTTLTPESDGTARSVQSQGELTNLANELSNC